MLIDENKKGDFPLFEKTKLKLKKEIQKKPRQKPKNEARRKWYLMRRK